MLLDEYWHDRGLVFGTRFGTPIHPHRFSRPFHRLRGRADWPNPHFHDLWYSGLSLLTAQGISAWLALEIAGYSSIRLTQNVYSHIYEEAKQQAVDAMDRLVMASFLSRRISATGRLCSCPRSARRRGGGTPPVPSAMGRVIPDRSPAAEYGSWWFQRRAACNCGTPHNHFSEK